jgi:putative oxidoreductase
MEKYGNLAARVLIAVLFLPAGLNKIMGYEGTQAYMEAMGVPGVLLPLVIILEIGGGLALILGWQIRYIALSLAGFTVVAALIFHSNFSDQMQMIMFMKNIAIAGGLLALSAQDIRQTISIDHWRLAAQPR